MTTTRRNLLQLAGGLSLASLLGACGSTPSEASAAASGSPWDASGDAGYGADASSVDAGRDADAGADSLSDTGADVRGDLERTPDADVLDVRLEPDRGPDTPDAIAGGITYKPSELQELQNGAVLSFHTEGDGGTATAELPCARRIPERPRCSTRGRMATRSSAMPSVPSGRTPAPPRWPESRELEP